MWLYTKTVMYVSIGAGSSLLAQPSASLRRLIGGGEWSAGGSLSAFEAPRVDAEALMSSPVMSFILAKRDLHAHRQKMDAAVRINTVRQYAFEVRTNTVCNILHIYS